MRRTNTDYKFNDAKSNVDYLSTRSLKSNYCDVTTMQSNLNHIFSHPCNLNTVNGNVCNKVACTGAIESGIGSSISSIDMHWLTNGAQCSSINSNESEPILINACHVRYDCHDLAPVSEEDDTDCLIGALHKVGEGNTHLDQLPWRDLESKTTMNRLNSDDLSSQLEELSLCEHLCQYPKNNNDECVDLFLSPNLDCLTSTNYYPWLTLTNDPLYIATSSEDSISHLRQPWAADAHCPILSSICHNFELCLTQTDLCHNHLSCINNNDKDLFYRRQNFQNSSCNVKSINICDNRANIFDEDNNEDHIQVRANERVVEWLKRMTDEEGDIDQRTFYYLNDDD